MNDYARGGFIRPATVFGIPSPWGGDENEPRDWRYQVWARAYRLTRRLRHRVGLHDYFVIKIGLPYHRRCTWCGRSK